jgi:hypothetical protein
VEEHVLDDHAFLSLDPVGGLAPVGEQPLQLRGQVEDATFHVLRRSRIQSNLTGLQIDLTPLQRQNFTVDPVRLIKERYRLMIGVTA